MYNLFEVLPKRDGKFKVKFLKENIYKFIRTELSIFYLKSNEESGYVRIINNEFKALIFTDIRDVFRVFFEQNYEQIENHSIITLDEFREEFFRQRPIRDNNIIKNRLSIKINNQ